MDIEETVKQFTVEFDFYDCWIRCPHCFDEISVQQLELAEVNDLAREHLKENHLVQQTVPRT